jgi:hypothetical protein
MRHLYEILFAGLSFGAPFWFEQVNNVASMRDALSKTKAPVT